MVGHRVYNFVNNECRRYIVILTFCVSFLRMCVFEW